MVKQVTVEHRPPLLRDNGSAYISADLADYLARHGVPHTHSAPYYSQTQDKIERYHRSIKNLICLEKFYFPSQLEQAVIAFVNQCNHHRYHESLDNLTSRLHHQKIQKGVDFISCH